MRTGIAFRAPAGPWPYYYCSQHKQLEQLLVGVPRPHREKRGKMLCCCTLHHRAPGK